MKYIFQPDVFTCWILQWIIMKTSIVGPIYTYGAKSCHRYNKLKHDCLETSLGDKYCQIFLQMGLCTSELQWRQKHFQAHSTVYIYIILYKTLRYFLWNNTLVTESSMNEDLNEMKTGTVITWQSFKEMKTPFNTVCGSICCNRIKRFRHVVHVFQCGPKFLKIHIFLNTFCDLNLYVNSLIRHAGLISRIYLHIELYQ